MAVVQIPTGRRAATRERLIVAAQQVVARSGFLGTSVDAIVAEAGVTKGALYSNFADKDELLVEVLTRQTRAAALAQGDAFEGLSIPEMVRMFAEGIPKVGEGDVMRSLDVQLWLLQTPLAREAHLPTMMAGVARAADWFATQGHPLPVPPVDEVLLQAALIAGLAYLRALLGPGMVRDDLVVAGASLLAGTATPPSEFAPPPRAR